MPRFERPSTDEILGAMPELAAYGRPAVLLEPEPGAPGVRDSSLGGPLLWPREDPWPSCSIPDEIEPSGLPPVTMAPVAQVFARDVPGPWWPEGVDLLQILWCPNDHERVPRNQMPGCPVIELRWRSVADVRDVVVDPPRPSRQDEDFYVLTPCTITTEQLTDFPYIEELPEALRPRLLQLAERAAPSGGDVITRLAGWKVGGWPTWHLTSPMTFTCGVCGMAMGLLFTIASDDDVGTVVGRWGELRLFVCPDHEQEFQADLH